MAKRKAEFLIKGTPDVVLEMVRRFLESDKWPYPLERDRSFSRRTRGPRSSVTRPSDPITKRNELVATIAKPGMPQTLLWIFGYGKRVSVSTVRDEPGWTKLTVKATKSGHLEALAAWIQRELIGNEAAARAEAP